MIQVVFKNRGAGKYEVITPNNTYTLLQSDAHSQQMIADFSSDFDKLASFAQLLEENPLIAYEKYNNIPIPSPSEDEQGISAQKQ